MNQEKTIETLRKRNKQLQEENEQLKKRLENVQVNNERVSLELERVEALKSDWMKQLDERNMQRLCLS